MGTSAVLVTPGAGFSGATTVVTGASSDVAGYVTFTTATTIPASPYLIFTLTWGGSWASPYSTPPVVGVHASANPFNARTAAQMAAAAALGPFYVILSSNLVKADVYCTNAPAISTAYDIGYIAVQGP